MSMVGRKVAVVLALVAIVTLAFSTLLKADEQQIRDEFRKAINAYEEGNYKEAKVHFAAVLNLNPSKKLAAELRDAATLRYLYQIAKVEEIGPDIWRLISLAAQYDKERMRDPENIKKLVKQMEQDAANRKIAMAQLIEIGPYAIPYLVPGLSDPNAEDGMRTYAFVTVNKMGRAAVQPLIELLNSDDDLLVKNCCYLLAGMNDIRPVPYLLKIALDEKVPESTRAVAAFAFKKLAGTPVEKAEPIENYFYREALRYYIDSPLVQEEAYSSEGIVWRWDAAKKNVVPVATPMFTYNEEIAKERCFDGLKAAPKSPIFTPLLVCVGYSALCELEERMTILSQQYARGLEEPAKSQVMAQLKEYDTLMQKLRRANVLGHLVGRRNLYKALSIALKHKKTNEIVAIIGALADVSDGSLLPPPGSGDTYERTEGAPLIDALMSKDNRVSYEAAIGLARIDPKQPFHGMDKVALVLTAAMGETSSLNLLVIENDIALMNKLVEMLHKAGYGAQGAFSGRNGIAKAGIFPMKDIILLDYTLDEEGDLTADQVYRRLKEAPHTRNIPVVFLVPTDAISEFKAKFPGEHPYITKPVDEAEMKKVIAEVVKKGNFDNPFRKSVNDIAKRAAAAVASINPETSKIALKPAVPALIAAFGSHIDEVRIGAITALANLKEASALDPLKALFKNKDNSSQVRLASLMAIGRIDPAAAKDLLEEAIADADYDIALEGAKALGHRDFDTETINSLIRKINK